MAAVFSVVVSLCINHVLGSLHQNNLVDNSSQKQRLQEFFDLISRNFAQIAEVAIRDAFIDNSFEVIKSDSLAAANLFREHLFSITEAIPQGDPNSLSLSGLKITEAASRFNVLFEKLCAEPKPPYLDVINNRQISNPINYEVDQKIKSYIKKLETIFFAYKAISCYEILILSKKAEQFPGINGLIRERVQYWAGIAPRIDAELRCILQSKVYTTGGFTSNDIAPGKSWFYYIHLCSPCGTSTNVTVRTDITATQLSHTNWNAKATVSYDHVSEAVDFALPLTWPGMPYISGPQQNEILQTCILAAQRLVWHHTTPPLWSEVCSHLALINTIKGTLPT